MASVGKQILDLDFRKGPTIVGVKQYFRTMWGSRVLPRLGVRTIPAAEYLRDYSPKEQAGSPLPSKNYSYYLHDKGKRYGLAPAQRLLKQP